MLVGATGTSGRLILAEALRRGHAPILAGRNATALQQLAAEHGGLPTAVLDLRDLQRTTDVVSRAALVLNAAGPFSATALPLAEAAVTTRRPYLDLSNEPPVTRALAQLDDHARRAATLLLPGVGFGVVVADCLASHLLERLPDADTLVIAVAPHVAGMTPALAATALLLVAAGATTITNGTPTLERPGRISASVPLPAGARRVAASVTADVHAVHRSTGVSNIKVLTTEVPAGRFAAVALPIASRAMQQPNLHRAALKLMELTARPVRTEGRSQAWGSASVNDGDTVTATLDLDDGYLFTASAAVRAVEQTLQGDPVIGYQTPSAAFGADFILGISDTMRNTN